MSSLVDRVRRAGDAAKTAASRQAQGDPTFDPIVAGLEWMARHFGRPFSASSLRAGLPVEDGQCVPPGLVPRAAARLGLKAAAAARLPSSVPALLLPCLVILDSGDAAVLVGRSGRKAKVVFPQASPRPRTVRFADLDRVATGPLFLITDDQDATVITRREAARPRKHWLWGTVLRFWPAWIQVMISAFLVNLLGLAFPLFVMNVYDRVIPNAATATLWALTVGVLIALAFELILRQLRALVLDQTGRLVDMKVGAELFAHALAIRMEERRQATGALANQIREFDGIREFFTSSSVIAATDLVFIGLGIGLLWLIVGPIASIPLLAVPLVIVFTLLIQIPLGRSVRSAQAQGARRHAVLVEALSAIETIKALTAENVMQRRWEHAVAASARASSSTRFWSSLALYGTVTMQQLVGVAVIGWGVFLVSEGNISMGALIAASMLAARILSPLGSIAQTLARAQQTWHALRSVGAFMRLAREGAGVIAGSQTVTRGSLTFRGVSFTYPDAQQRALQDIELTVAGGERVGLLGRVGSGKSTLGRLLAGLYSPNTGTILVDDVELARYEPADLRAGIGFVAQETELFEGTLRDNLTIGARAAGEAEIAEVCRVTGVDAFATAHPAGLMMPIGEKGRGLSGGQRQAVVLARMLLRQPRILFLDEPTSAMDMGSEADLVRRLAAALRPEQTLIVCTHRVSLLELVDRLVVLDQGRIVADGPKEAVLRQLKLNSAGPGRDAGNLGAPPP